VISLSQSRYPQPSGYSPNPAYIGLDKLETSALKQVEELLQLELTLAASQWNVQRLTQSLISYVVVRQNRLLNPSACYPQKPCVQCGYLQK